MDMSWDDASRATLLAGLGMVPEVGDLLSALVGILWDSPDDVWGEIKAQVEALIDAKISEEVYHNVQDSLSGLQSNVALYLQFLQMKSSSGDTIKVQWVTTYNLFLHDEPCFTKNGYQLLLLPLYVQFVSLKLSLLRDAVRFGTGWGLDAGNIASFQNQMTTFIAKAVSYAQNLDQTQLAALTANTGRDDHQAEPFRTLNGYNRSMTLMVRDFVQMWPYFDPSQYPNPVPVMLGREIFSDPYGTCDNGGPIHLEASPTGKIVGMSFWGGDRLDAAQVGYTDGGAPGGGSSTGRMGGPNGSSLPPSGGRFPVAPDDPITGASCKSGDVVTGVNFGFASGKGTRWYGGGQGGGYSGVSFAGHYLCRMYVNGVSVFYGQSIECVVFGFKMRDTQTVGRMVQQHLYTTSPTQVSASAFGARLPAGTANLLHVEPRDVDQLEARRGRFAGQISQWSKA